MTEAAGTKRVNEGVSSWEGGKKMRGDSITLRFLLNAKHAGGIIGKGGETIKRLRSEFSANVTVPDTNTNERVLTIIGNPENSLKVLRECLPLVKEAPYPIPGARNEDGNQVEIDFLVHQSQVGGIIGKGGFKIKEIREETSAKVKAYAECLPDSTERVVAIAGSADQLINALQLMLKVIDANPIKGHTQPYDPSYEHNTFNSSFNDNFNNNNTFGGPPSRGGMRGGRGGGGGPRGGMRGGGGGGGGNFSQGGYGGGGMGQQQDYGNNYSGDNYSNNWNQGGPQGDYGYGSGGGGNYGGGNSGGNYGGGNFGGGNYGGPPSALGGGNSQGGGGGQNSTQVTVPNDMAGAIIGKGGERIRQIRQKSQADIKFSDSEAGKTDRLITINGTHDQIQYAQYLMQQCVRENYSGQ